MSKRMLYVIAVIIVAFLAVISFLMVRKNITQEKKTGAENASLPQQIDLRETSPKSWKELYYAFLREESDCPKYTLSKFQYAFVALEGFAYPVLLIKDDYNMYLFYQQKERVLPALDNEGDQLALLQMKKAYERDGKIFVEGANNTLKSNYLCEITWNASFELQFLVGKYIRGGKMVYYHDKQGQELSSKQYEDQIRQYLENTKPVSFVSELL